jgi:phage gp36-like protein
MAYCSRTDIDAVFGVSNVTTWANQENDGTQVVARVALAISIADAQIDGFLFGGPYFTIPFASAHILIVDASARLSGVYLYENRGIDDYDAATKKASHSLSFIQDKVMMMLKKIKTGVIRLDLVADRVEETPLVVD